MASVGLEGNSAEGFSKFKVCIFESFQGACKVILMVMFLFLGIIFPVIHMNS